MDDIESLLTKKEALHEDLLPFVYHRPGMAWTYINHPLVQEVPFIAQDRCALINARYLHKQKALAKAREEGEWHTFIWLHERPFRFDALKKVMAIAKLSSEELALLVGEVWIDSENIWQNQAAWIALWQSLPHPHLAMEDHDRGELEALADVLPVYRGINSARKNPNGLSWTLDKEKATWFAKRYHRPAERCILISGQVSKSNVFAYFSARGEREIVTLASHVKKKQREILS